jgi:hypothetical protein
VSHHWRSLSPAQQAALNFVSRRRQSDYRPEHICFRRSMEGWPNPETDELDPDVHDYHCRTK